MSVSSSQGFTSNRTEDFPLSFFLLDAFTDASRSAAAFFSSSVSSPKRSKSSSSSSSIEEAFVSFSVTCEATGAAPSMITPAPLPGKLEARRAVIWLYQRDTFGNFGPGVPLMAPYTVMSSLVA
eukprot:Gb_07697 [translate_table: standard]